jgi:hypothetical protein
MVNFVVDKSVDNVIDGVADYLMRFTPAKIIRANVNRTAMPKVPFVVLTEILSAKLSKPVEQYSITGETITEKNRIDIQIDFYGWELSDIALSFTNSIHTSWAADNFPSWLAPLYCTDATKIPLHNAEEQYEQRWTTTLSLQYNVTMNLPQASFNAVGEIVLDPVDITISDTIII